jgi:AcrR family transcriptional regulator
MSTVTRPERTRLLEAMLEELVEKGYPAVEVEAAIHRARLVGEDWSAQFPDKDTCLAAAFDELTGELRTAICEGCLTANDWPGRVAGGLRVLLAQLSERAAIAEALARSFPSIGPAALTRYQGFIESLAPLLAEGREFSGMGDELPAEVELLAVGSAESIVFEQIQLGHTARLATMTPEILFSVLVPFTGPVAAAKAMEEEQRQGEKVAPGGRGSP